MPNYLKLKAVEIADVKAAVLEGVNVINVSVLEHSPTVGDNRVELYFLPNSLAFAGWTRPSLSVGQSSSDPHSVSQIRIHYDYKDGTPVPKIASYWTEDFPDATVKRSEYRFEMTDVTFDPVPASKFTLADLGVREPGAPPTIGESPARRWWLGANAMVLLCGAGLLFWLYRGRRSTDIDRE